MTALPKLHFPPVKLRARQQEGQVEVWDDLRRIYLVLTPEEWVRRHLIEFLISDCAAPPKRIMQEYAVALNGQPQRADVVVVDHAGQPLLLAECKSAEVAIDDKTLSQAVRYNSVVGARYLILTNGLAHFCYEYCNGDYRSLPDFPLLG
ncbi:MAG: type I restriction enzyme HsdR N-terminal domain-containing protein [Alistipes sp.]